MAYFESRIDKCFHISINEDEIRIVTNDSLVRFTLPEDVKDVDINDYLKISLSDLSEQFDRIVEVKNDKRKEVERIYRKTDDLAHSIDSVYHLLGLFDEMIAEQKKRIGQLERRIEILEKGGEAL